MIPAGMNDAALIWVILNVKVYIYLLLHLFHV